MTLIYSEAIFDKKDVHNFLKTNDWKDDQFAERFADYGRVDYVSLKMWLNANFARPTSDMIMRKIECDCVAYIDELHI